MVNDQLSFEHVSLPGLNSQSPVPKAKNVGLILALYPGSGLESSCTRNDRLTAFRHEYGPVPLARFATPGPQTDHSTVIKQLWENSQGERIF